MPNISLRTPHRAKKATSVSSDRAPPLRIANCGTRPGAEKTHLRPGQKRRGTIGHNLPPFSRFPPPFFRLSSRPNTRAHVTRASVGFRFSPSPLHIPSQLPVALQIRCEGFAPESFTFASPDFCTKSPCRNNLHRTFSHGELCMNVNASPFCRRSAMRFNGLAREGEG